MEEAEDVSFGWSGELEEPAHGWSGRGGRQARGGDRGVHDEKRAFTGRQVEVSAWRSLGVEEVDGLDAPP